MLLAIRVDWFDSREVHRAGLLGITMSTACTLSRAENKLQGSSIEMLLFRPTAWVGLAEAAVRLKLDEVFRKRNPEPLK